ncbi:MAG: hypothetical protein AAF492_31285, partial [Verrucomicrobiota bacterium]
TVTGQILGTPGFMPPEQALGRQEEVGPRSDVYAIGATFYFLLTGLPPFVGTSVTETIRKVVDHEPAPPRRVNTSIPRDLETICLKCLHKNADRRYASAAELASDLARWTNREPILGRRPGLIERTWLWCRRHPASAAALVALLLAGMLTAGLMLRQEWRNTREVARSRVEMTLNAPPEGLPYALRLLEPLASPAKPLLEQCLNDPSQTLKHRLNAAMALAYFGDDKVEFLLAHLADFAPAECPNLVTALRGEPKRSLNRLHQRYTGTANLHLKARAAILSLHLGNPALFEHSSRLQADPKERTTLWTTLTRWHGQPLEILTAAIPLITPEAKAAICLGMGRVSEDAMTEDVQTSWHPHGC